MCQLLLVDMRGLPFWIALDILVASVLRAAMDGEKPLPKHSGRLVWTWSPWGRGQGGSQPRVSPSRVHQARQAVHPVSQVSRQARHRQG